MPTEPKPAPSDIWPDAGYTHIPYALYDDPEIYARERDAVFKGPVWHYLALDCEIPQPGDYKTLSIADIPVVVLRARDGGIRAFENRCMHRGALLCRERFGNARNLTCIYHAWSYNHDGELVGVAFEKGVGGKGGMPPSFNRGDHNLKSLKTARKAGLIFGSFDVSAPDLDRYLGADICRHLERVAPKPLEVRGYHTQSLRNNWKLYAENVKDSYHASILHLFFTTFKVNRLTQRGGIIVDPSGAHHVSYSMLDGKEAGAAYAQENLRADNNRFGLKDGRVLAGCDEFGDGITLQILSIFPATILQQIKNSLVIRQIVPKGPDRCDVVWTHYGFADDDDTLRNMRQFQSNLVGPAGYISMEDGAVGAFIQRALPGAESERSVVLMGGDAVESQETRATETSVRGFWKIYRKLMRL